EDGSGGLIDTTVTDANGNYTFNAFDGLAATGNYQVRLVVPTGLVQTSANPPTILISRGNIDRDGVNFGVNFPSIPSGPGALFLSASVGGGISAVGASSAERQAPSTPMAQLPVNIVVEESRPLAVQVSGQDLLSGPVPSYEVTVGPIWQGAPGLQLNV